MAQQCGQKHDIQAVKMELEKERNKVKLALMQLKGVVRWLENDPELK